MDRPDEEWSADRWRRFADLERDAKQEAAVSVLKQRALKERVARGDLWDDIGRDRTEGDHGG